MSKRKQPNLTEMLATALLQLFPDVITFQAAKELTAKQIIARVRASHDLHHWTYVAVLGGTNHPTNMSWLHSTVHDERTRKIDVPAIAKMKRHAKKQECERQDAKPNGAARSHPKQRIRSRGFPTRAERARVAAWREEQAAAQADRQGDSDGLQVGRSPEAGRDISRGSRRGRGDRRSRSWARQL